VTHSSPVLQLTDGRRVSMLPRSGGHAWAGIVRAWASTSDHVVARIQAAAEAVTNLDHHQVWLSTVSRSGDEHGITIFAGKALAVDRESLDLQGVVRLTDERRRKAVRAPGGTATIPAQAGAERTVAVRDISRGGVRLQLDDAGWAYDEPLDLTLHLGGGVSLDVHGHLLRLDHEGKVAVLAFADLHVDAAAALDRYVLTHVHPD
jgi:hypothetical protein